MDYRNRIGKLGFALVAGVWGLTATATARLDIYVGSRGNDSYDGLSPTVNKVAKTGPKKTMAGALNVVRNYKAKGWLDPSGVMITWMNGTYNLTTPIVITSNDTMPDIPMTIKAETPGQVILDAGRYITMWRRPARSYAQFISPTVWPYIRSTNIRSYRGSQFLRRRGGKFSTSDLQSELFFDGQREEVAQYPNTGWLYTPSNQSYSSNTLKLSEDRYKKWSSNSVWISGYLGYDWADDTDHATIDANAGTATLDNNASYGVNRDMRYKYVNVVEELDQPGEYWINQRDGTLLYYPKATNLTKRVWITSMPQSVMSVSFGKNLTIEGFVIQGSRKNGIDISGGTNLTIRGCTVRNVGSMGVTSISLTNSVIEDCDVYGTGESGIQWNGGNRYTLTAGNNIVRNCHVHHFAQTVRAYRPGIHLYGCGNLATNNRIEEGPHVGMLAEGNNHTIENNQFFRLCMETEDCGALYFGRDITSRGMVVRNNLFQDIVGRIDKPNNSASHIVGGLYLDDLYCGATVENNVFRRVGIGIHIGGGRENTIENNVFENNRTAIYADARGYNNPGLWAQYNYDAALAAVNYTQPPYSTAYPRLPSIASDDRLAPKYNRIGENVMVNSSSSALEFAQNVETLTYGDGEKAINFGTNYDGLLPGFLDSFNGDYRATAGSNADQSGFQGFTLSNVGLQPSTFRSTIPPLPSTDSPSLL
ncbi:MAG: right-handed parallel beta-helix repeat-containing protein [Armatimonadetes bacterium]|nr:right-handed parallel beta-helix repeat-containing protein [Armatimonadota bacterium]